MREACLQEASMDELNVAHALATVIADEIDAQLGVHRRVEDMPPLIADAILDAFTVQTRDGVKDLDH
jgi:hypothetical protein